MQFKSVIGAGILLLASALISQAQLITATSEGSLATMPGSSSDYTFFGNAAQFPDISNYFGAKTQPTVLTDFTVAHGADGVNSYQGDNRYSTINGPVGSGQTAVQTGIIFQGGVRPDFVDFTLGTTASTFNFSNFDAHVMYGNGYGDSGVRDFSLTLSLLSSTGSVLATSAEPVVDNPAGSNGNADPEADFVDFHVTGAAAGDVLRFGATGNNSYLGGVSFSEAPEPGTWAMLLAGFVGLLVVTKRRLKA